MSERSCSSSQLHVLSWYPKPSVRLLGVERS